MKKQTKCKIQKNLFRTVCYAALIPVLTGAALWVFLGSAIAEVFRALHPMSEKEAAINAPYPGLAGDANPDSTGSSGSSGPEAWSAPRTNTFDDGRRDKAS